MIKEIDLDGYIQCRAMKGTYHNAFKTNKITLIRKRKAYQFDRIFLKLRKAGDGSSVFDHPVNGRRADAQFTGDFGDIPVVFIQIEVEYLQVILLH
jgi:hypothetical protein